jgi:hypothetical protein
VLLVARSPRGDRERSHDEGLPPQNDRKTADFFRGEEPEALVSCQDLDL